MPSCQWRGASAAQRHAATPPCEDKPDELLGRHAQVGWQHNDIGPAAAELLHIGGEERQQDTNEVLDRRRQQDNREGLDRRQQHTNREEDACQLGVNAPPNAPL